MKTNVQQSSIECYYDQIHGEKELDQAGKALDYIRKHGRCTRRQIAHHYGWETGTCSRAVNSLLNADKPEVFAELELFPCPITGTRVHWVYAIPKQARLI